MTSPKLESETFEDKVHVDDSLWQLLLLVPSAELIPTEIFYIARSEVLICMYIRVRSTDRFSPFTDFSFQACQVKRCDCAVGSHWWPLLWTQLTTTANRVRSTTPRSEKNLTGTLALSSVHIRGWRLFGVFGPTRPRVVRS